MKQSKLTFKAQGAWDIDAYLAVQNHQLAMTVVLPREKSAHLRNFLTCGCFESVTTNLAA